MVLKDAINVDVERPVPRPRSAPVRENRKPSGREASRLSVLKHQHQMTSHNGG